MSSLEFIIKNFPVATIYDKFQGIITVIVCVSGKKWFCWSCYLPFA